MQWAEIWRKQVWLGEMWSIVGEKKLNRWPDFQTYMHGNPTASQNIDLNVILAMLVMFPYSFVLFLENLAWSVSSSALAQHQLVPVALLGWPLVDTTAAASGEKFANTQWWKVYKHTDFSNLCLCFQTSASCQSESSGTESDYVQCSQAGASFLFEKNE